ncbi:MAG: ATP synthase subunit I [Desulfuromonadaceae bacterium]|nr:ATP synthase subunit I [Desulfuromonadaceae bacterium]
MTETTDQDADAGLLRELAKRNWLILLGLLLLSPVARDVDFSLGILCGGLTVVVGYQWLHRSLVKALSAPGQPAVRGFQMGYVFRLAALAVMLVLLIAVVRVNIPGLIVGLSVVVINLMWTTVRRIL